MTHGQNSDRQHDCAQNLSLHRGSPFHVLVSRDSRPLNPAGGQCCGSRTSPNRGVITALGILGHAFGPVAYSTTVQRRQERLEAAAKRYAERRRFWLAA